jgi:hypothetical protein
VAAQQREGTAQHKMPSNRENVSRGGRGHGNGRRRNGGLGCGSHHAMVTYISPEAKKMLSYGLSLVRFGKKRQKCQEALSIRRFQAYYGIGPGAVKQLANDLKEKYDEPFNLPNLFMALNLLKLYCTEEVMAGKWGHGKQYCRENTKKYVRLIRSIKSKKSHFVGCIKSADLLLLTVCTSYAMSLGVTQTANGGHIS